MHQKYLISQHKHLNANFMVNQERIDVTLIQISVASDLHIKKEEKIKHDILHILLQYSSANYNEAMKCNHCHFLVLMHSYQ